MNWRKLEPKVPQNKVSWVCHKGVKLHFKKFFKARKMGKDLEQKKASKGCGCGCRRCANHVGSGMHLPCTSDKRKKRRTGKKKTGGGRGCRGETRSTKNWKSIDCEPEMKTRRNENSRTHHRCSEGPAARDPNLWVWRRILVKWNTGTVRRESVQKWCPPKFSSNFSSSWILKVRQYDNLQVPRKFALELGYKK